MVARLARFRTPAVRRRVLHGLRNEAEFAQAMGGANLPDSEPADVVIVATTDGELLTDHHAVRQLLTDRERGLRWRKHPPPPLVNPDADPDFMARLPREQRVRVRAIYREDLAERGRVMRALESEVFFIEVKTLIVQQGAGAIHMSRAAVRRKERWEKRFAAKFHSVAFDDRRGKKHSGNRLYFKAGVGSAKLSDMQTARDFQAIAEAIMGKGE